MEGGGGVVTFMNSFLQNLHPVSESGRSLFSLQIPGGRPRLSELLDYCIFGVLLPASYAYQPASLEATVAVEETQNFQLSWDKSEFSV